MSSYAESTRSLTHGSFTPSSPSISESGTAVESLASPPSTKCNVFRECTQHFDKLDKQNPEKNLEFPCHGWPALAQLMAQRPGFESFQVFRDLNVKSLLYYQAELVSLRAQLHEFEWKDHRHGGFELSDELCANIEFLILTEPGTPRERKQISLVRKIRRILKEYNEALLQYAKINGLPEADEFNVNSLRTWIGHRNLGAFNVRGPGQKSWGDPADLDPHKKRLWESFKHLLRSVSIFWVETPKTSHPDLVVPYPNKEIDGFTRWVAHDWIPFWHNLKDVFRRRNGKELPTTSTDRDSEKRRPSSTSSASTPVRLFSSFSETLGWTSPKPSKDGDFSDQPPSLETYHMSGMRKFTSFVTTIVACLLPTAAIAVLATIHNHQAKTIGFIALFTGVFAMGLMVLTPSVTSRTEIFTATAAFSAVLVVFVQNQGG